MPSEAAEYQLSVRLQTELTDHIDKVRGDRTRGAYVRELIRRDALQAEGPPPAPVTTEEAIAPPLNPSVAHRCRPSSQFREYVDKGRRWRVYTCGGCGQELTPR